MSILVIGDAIVDKHVFGSVSRISPEAPVPIIDVKELPRFSLGAAGYVAAQIAKVEECIFAYKTYLSDDGFLWNLCSQANVNPAPLYMGTETGPMTLKERVWAGNQQICRIDREKTNKPQQEIIEKWIDNIITIINCRDVKIVIFSDYDKGTLTDFLIQQITDHCKQKDIKTILDPKRYSYWGLQNLTIIKPNAKEIAITNMTPKDISSYIEATYLVNTLGKNGIKVWKNGSFLFEEKTFAKEHEVIDVCGSGDIVSAFLAIGLHVGLPLSQIIHLASLAAAENTKHIGCHILEKKQINRLIKKAKSVN